MTDERISEDVEDVDGEEVEETEESAGAVLASGTPTQDQLGIDAVPVDAILEVFASALQSARLRTHKRKDGSLTVKLEIGVGTKKAKFLYLPEIIQAMENVPSIAKIYKMATTEEGRAALVTKATATEKSLAGITL